MTRAKFIAKQIAKWFSGPLEFRVEIQDKSVAEALLNAGGRLLTDTCISFDIAHGSRYSDTKILVSFCRIF